MNHTLKMSLLLLLITSASTFAQSTEQWPFDRAPITTLQQSQKKVFIHYFSPFPISIDNKDPESDYYQLGFLTDKGENNKHRSYGGYIRQRPLPRLPRMEQDWVLSDLKEEIRMASQLGVDGFSFNMLSTPSQGKHWKKLLLMLEAVKQVDNGFKILLMPDMTAGFKSHPDELVPAIMQIADNSALYRLADGRLVIAAYNGQSQPPAYWASVTQQLETQGVKVALWPTFQAWWKYISDYAESSYGFSDWGTSTYDEQHNWRRQQLETVDRHGLKFMAPVRPQDFRPKNFYGAESRNSALFREMWHTALDANADWAQLITWNDYSEASEIAPSTHTRRSFYDLSAYYVSWFKTGKQPNIVRDALYYFHRIQPTTASPSSANQAKPFKLLGEAQNQIELLGFLKAPGTLEITIDGKTYRKDAPAGITSFSVPLVNGTPAFRIVRNDETVMEKQGAWEISDQIQYSNLLVHADGGTAEKPWDYSKPVALKTELQLGDLIQKVTTYASTTFNKTKGDPSTVTLPAKDSDIASQIEDGQGGFTFTLGMGKSHKGGKVQFGDTLKLVEGQEIVFHIKRLEVDTAGGWVAFFISASGDHGKINLTPRNSDQAYISSNLPKFKVEQGNIKVEYPAVYRIRKTDGKIEFIYNNDLIYTADAEKSEGLDKVEIYMGSQKPQAKALMEITAIEIRKVK
ncbi:MAG: hypothetical protein JKX85_00120 [Phycisphaeraceae bacterium]|nr:hypothetical protein [Phycisphaeraceae bacterium]